ncbi:MAG: glycosyltransferase [Acutalibacteraceae bacterium]|nr:glycosyltransferase [Acutalibacteraceae bacterium]
MSIPKVIHYCWFGRGDIPEKDLKCIESWKKYCPDYEIKCWNEDNYDVNKNLFIKQAYDKRKFAFVSDYARLDIIYNHGGIYFDVDVEVIKNIDSLLEHKAFFGLEEVESKYYVNSGLGFGAEKNLFFLKEIMEVYENSNFLLEDGNINAKPCPIITNEVLLKQKNLDIRKNKFYNVDGIIIYPTEYFNPKSYETGKLNITDNTMTIHHYDGTWIDETSRLYKKYSKIFGDRIASILVKCICMFKRGEKR